jgi:hypothetical protein
MSESALQPTRRSSEVPTAEFPPSIPHLLSSSGGFAWSAAKGIVAVLRLPDDIAGAEPGFRLLPFTAAVSSAARGRGGGGLSQGVHLGIITGGIARGLSWKSG